MCRKTLFTFLNSSFSSMGGFTPIINESGQITGYKTTKGGADTVFPFSSSMDILINGTASGSYVVKKTGSYIYQIGSNRSISGNMIINLTHNGSTTNVLNISAWSTGTAGKLNAETGDTISWSTSGFSGTASNGTVYPEYARFFIWIK